MQMFRRQYEVQKLYDFVIQQSAKWNTLYLRPYQEYGLNLKLFSENFLKNYLDVRSHKQLKK